MTNLFTAAVMGGGIGIAVGIFLAIRDINRALATRRRVHRRLAQIYEDRSYF